MSGGSYDYLYLFLHIVDRLCDAYSLRQMADRCESRAKMGSEPEGPRDVYELREDGSAAPSRRAMAEEVFHLRLAAWKLRELADTIEKARAMAETLREVMRSIEWWESNDGNVHEVVCAMRKLPFP